MGPGLKFALGAEPPPPPHPLVVKFTSPISALKCSFALRLSAEIEEGT